MSNKGSNYTPLNSEELQRQWDKQKEFIEGFIIDNQYDPQNIFVDSNIVYSIISKVHQRKSYFSFFHKLKMSEYKEAALTSFWCIKLKPISVNPQVLDEQHKGEFDSINERLAVYYILKTLRVALISHNINTDMLDSIPQKYLNELIYTFTFRDISKEAMIMLIESMAIFLGLDPYAGKN